MITSIIADDFTGSNDTGVQLVKKGKNVSVLFDWEHIGKINSSNNSIVVINTESRAISNLDAKKRIETVVKNYGSNLNYYKKIDSTMRGNIGSEIEALLDAGQYETALVIPAFPNLNRTTKDGKCYINGVELIKTEFATDPKTPIYSSKIKECIAQQTNYSCKEIFLNQVRSVVLKEQIEKLINSKTRIVVIDSEKNEDLKYIIEQVISIKSRVLLVGSAGLIDFLPIEFNSEPITKPKQSFSPMLVVAGSMSQVTQKQIEYTLAHGGSDWRCININIIDLLPFLSESLFKTYCKQIQDAFSNNQNCIIRTSDNFSDRHKIEHYCQKYQLTRFQLGEKICQILGDIVNNIPFHNIFLTGGDVAIAIAKSLGAIGFTIEGEVAPGIPYGTLISKKPLNYKIFTKAGGFGSQDIFLKSLEFI